MEEGQSRGNTGTRDGTEGGWVVPQLYDIHITPSFVPSNDIEINGEFPFVGQETIELKITRPGLSTITLNAKGLVIDKVHLSYPPSSEAIVPREIITDETTETISFVFQVILPHFSINVILKLSTQPLTEGDASLFIQFRGFLNDPQHMCGKIS